MNLKDLFVLFSFIGITFASPVSWDTSKCSKQCKHSSDKFLYKERTSYVYDYESTNILRLEDLDSNATVIVKAELEITKVDSCEMLLQMKDVRINIDGEITNTLHESMNYPLPFSFKDGEINEICPKPDEIENVLNFKRAVLSNLQNTMSSFNVEHENVEEKDIIGNCHTDYEVMEKRPNRLVVRKQKNLKNCSDRLTIIPAILLAANESTNILPSLKKENYNCKQTIERGIITNVICQEGSNFIISFEGEDDYDIVSSAAVRLNLRDVKRSDKLPSYEIHERKTLHYDYTPEAYSDTDPEKLINILSDICFNVRYQEKVNSKLPNLFSRLVKTLRKMSPAAIEDVYNKIDKVCQSSWLKSLVYDALPYIGNEGSTKVMVKIIKSGTISKLQTALWVTSFAFIKNPTEEIISSAVPLLDYQEAGKQALLAITAMCNNYCAKTTNCENNEAIREVIQSLNRYIRYGCKASGNIEINQVIAALKSFGNLGRIGSASRQILQCAAQTSNHITVRLAAIEAFRRTPCREDVIEQLFNIFSRSEEPVEVRIAAYLGTMKCADKELVRRIKRVYDSERLIQIKAFVYSHATNLQESSSPLKKDIKSILSEFQFEPQYLDIMKYSKNIEWSNYLQQLKIGGEFDSNIIYSEDSFIPRSFMTNFTSFFRNNVFNPMEFGGRMEGFDHVMKGLFSSVENSDLMNYIFSMAKEKTKFIWPASRTSDYKYKSKPVFSEKFKLSAPSNARGSFYFKHQGNELMWVTIDEKTDFNFGKAVDFMDILSELARTQKIDRAHGLYLDTSITFPSIAGGAVTFELDGSLILGLKGEGKADIRKVFSSPRNIDIDGKLRTSISGEINAVMSYKSLTQAPKVKYVANIDGDVTAKGKLAIKDGRLFNMQIDLPEEKTNILSVSVNATYVNIYGEELSIPRYPRDVGGCIKTFRKVMGYDICTETTLPHVAVTSKFPYIPFSGPFTTKISLLKRDPSMRGFLLNIELPDHNVYSPKKFKIEFDTPGSSMDRKHSLEVVSVKPSDFSDVRSFDLQLQTPFKAINARVAIVKNPTKKSLKLDLKIDRQRHWSVFADLETNKRGNVVQYDTKLELASPDREPVSLTGSISYKKGRKTVLSINLRRNSSSLKPMQITGNIVKEGDISIMRQSNWKLSTDMNVKFPFFESQVSGIAQKNEKIVFSDVTINYQREGHRQDTLRANCKIQNLSSRHFTKVVTAAEIRSTQYPQRNVQLDWNFQYKQMELLENELTIKSGSDLRKLFSVFQISKFRKSDVQEFMSENKLVINAPQHGIDYELQISVNHNSETLDSVTKLDVIRDQHKYISSSLEYHISSMRPLVTGITFVLEYPGRVIKYIDELHQVSVQDFRGKTILQWQEGHQAILNYTYTIKSEYDDFHHEIDATFDAPWLHVPMKHKGLLKMSRDSIDIKGSTSFEGKSPYKIDVKISPKGKSKINVDLSKYGKSDIEFDSDTKTTLLKFDIFRPANNRRITGQLTLEMLFRVKTVFRLEANLDADRDPTSKLLAEIEYKLMEYGISLFYIVKGKLQYKKDINVDVIGKFNTLPEVGPHDLQINIKQKKPISIKMHYDNSFGDLNFEFACKSENKQLFQTILAAKYLDDDKNLERGFDVILSSSDKRWDGKEIHFSHIVENSDYFSEKMRLQINLTPDKLYVMKSDYYDENSDIEKFIASIQTPIPGWKIREISTNVTRNYDPPSLTYNAYYKTDEGKMLDFSMNIKKIEEEALSFQADLQLPMFMKSAKIEGRCFLQSSHYKLESNVYVDGQKQLEVNGNIKGSDERNFEANFQLKSKLLPILVGRINSKLDGEHKKFDLMFSKDSIEKLSGKITADSSRSAYNAALQINAEGESIVYAKINCIERGDDNQECRMNLDGAIPPITVNFSYREEYKMIESTVNACWKTKHRNNDCVIFEGHYRNEVDLYNNDYIEGKLLIKRPRAGDMSLEFLSKKSEHKYINRLIFKSPGKKIGYDANLDFHSLKSITFSVFAPSRVIKVVESYQMTEQEIFKFGLFPDAERKPSKQFGFELTQTDNNLVVNRHILYMFQLKFPDRSQPILAKFEMRNKKNGNMLLMHTNVEIDCFDDPKDKIMGSIHIEKVLMGQGNNTIVFNVHKYERQYLDFTTKMHLGYTLELITSGLEWSYSNRNRRTSGHSLIMIYIPEHMFKIWHNCDWMRLEGRGRWTRLNDVSKTDIDLRINDKQKKIAFIIDNRQNCLNVNYYSRNSKSPDTESRFCIFPDFKYLLLKWFKIVLDYITSLDDYLMQTKQIISPTFYSDSVQNSEFFDKFLAFFSDISEHVENSEILSDPMKVLDLISEMFTAMMRGNHKTLYESLPREFSQISEEMTEDLRSATRTMRSIYEKLPSKSQVKKAVEPVGEYFDRMKYELKKFMEKIIPDSVMKRYDDTKKALIDMMKTVIDKIKSLCSEGTYCHELKTEFNQNGLKAFYVKIYKDLKYFITSIPHLRIVRKD